MIKKQINENLTVEGVAPFSLADTLDCGQAFRWNQNDGIWTGVAFGKILRVSQEGDCLTFYNTSDEEFENIWRKYFDLDRDYNIIKEALSVNPTLKKAVDYSGGIRLLNQDGWEAICSFIISQNNNIPRIKGIIERLCENFGEDLGGAYSFPSAEKISSLTVEDLAIIRSGFRAKYIIDGAKKVAGGEIDFTLLREGDIDLARQELKKIKGIGPKVADCALLFGFARGECFPVDVWIRRAVNSMFGGEIPSCALPYAGIAQQYIFHYARGNNIEI